MAEHSIAEAKNRFSELIDRALGGEQVIVTRHGQPVIEFRPVSARPEPGRITAADLEWLDRIRVRPRKPFSEDGATLVRRMRDEDEH